eukprot:161299-Chlamydomonas_euryale.AAC.4
MRHVRRASFQGAHQSWLEVGKIGFGAWEAPSCQVGALNGGGKHGGRIPVGKKTHAGKPIKR